MRNVRILMAVALLALGCGGSTGKVSDAELKKMVGGKLEIVVPVSGKVIVDGSAASGVVVNLYKLTGTDPFKTVRSGADGKYTWTTYDQGDGLPVGEYKLTFQKPTSKNSPTDDLLNGRYSDPEKSEFKLKVEAGNPQKNADFDLTSK